MLDDISAVRNHLILSSSFSHDCSQVKTWEKVNSGMIKMYKAEVLGKLPVAQHILFGSLLPYTGPPPPSSGDGMADSTHAGHGHEGWGDCCGIPVPSVFGAAAQAERDKRGPGAALAGPGIRPVPFD